MELRELGIPGCFEVRPAMLNDDRGWFVKPFQASAFEEAGLPTTYPERYYTESRQGVVRGLHFQVPPDAHHKLVYCVSGRAIDVFVDLRTGSPTFGKAASCELLDTTWNAVVLPVGIAHGFAALEDRTILSYSVGTEHAPASDTGIRWDSVDFEWPFDRPIVSARDRELPPLSSFDSPFVYGDA